MTIANRQQDDPDVHKGAVEGDRPTDVPQMGNPNDDGVDDFTFFDGAIWRGFFDVGFDNVADAGITLVSAENTDGGSALGAGVVSHVEN